MIEEEEELVTKIREIIEKKRKCKRRTYIIHGCCSLKEHQD